jgi:hypothetical protein
VARKDYIFPTDTIITANNKIILSKIDLKIDDTIYKITLNNPSDEEVPFINIKSISRNSTTSIQIVSKNNSYISVFEAEKLIKEYKQKLALNEQQINETESLKKVDLTKDINKDSSDNMDIIKTASVIDSVNSTSTKSFWSKLIDVPFRGIKAFARLFYDF